MCGLLISDVQMIVDFCGVLPLALDIVCE